MNDFLEQSILVNTMVLTGILVLIMLLTVSSTVLFVLLRYSGTKTIEQVELKEALSVLKADVVAAQANDPNWEAVDAFVGKFINDSKKQG